MIETSMRTPHFDEINDALMGTFIDFRPPAELVYGIMPEAGIDMIMSTYIRTVVRNAMVD